ncbi:MAG: HAD-IA family hydrolase [Dehalococcoidia bacterium]
MTITQQTFRGALFDLDDTLIDRAGSFERLFRIIYERDSAIRSTHSLEGMMNLVWEYDEWGTAPKEVLFERMLTQWPGMSGTVPELVAFYWAELLAGMRRIPGACEFVAELNQSGYPWGIVTNGDEKQYRKMESAGLDGVAPFAIPSQLFGEDKPAPGVFLEGLKRLGMESSEVLFVGDTPYTDIVGAHAVGMRTAWVSRGRAYPSDMPSPDYVIGHVSELRPLLVV